MLASRALRAELVARSSTTRATSPRPDAVAAPARLVARDRGAVLLAVAADRPADRALATPRDTGRRRAGRDVRRDRVGRVDGGAHDPRQRALRQQRVALLLRDGHARVRAAARLRRGGGRRLALSGAANGSLASQQDPRRARPRGARGVRPVVSARTSTTPASTVAGSWPSPPSAPSSSSRRPGAAACSAALDNPPMGAGSAGGRTGSTCGTGPVFVGDATRARHRVPRAGALFVPRVAHRDRDRGALVPLPRAADPPRGLQAVAAARDGGPGALVGRAAARDRARSGRPRRRGRRLRVRALAGRGGRPPQSPVFEQHAERPAPAYADQGVTPVKPPPATHHVASR